MVGKIFEWLFAAILLVAVLPCLVSVVVHALGPILVAAIIVGLVVGAFRSLERTRPRTSAPRGGAGSERTPILPEGDQ